MRKIKSGKIVVEDGKLCSDISGNPLERKAPLSENAVTISFYGTRGSIPSPGKETVRYGGNTACTVITRKNNLVILDSGSGIRKLGAELAQQMQKFNYKGIMFISHVHWDHIQGFPFFVPFYDAKNKFIVCGPKSVHYTLETVLKVQMQPPHFPVKLSDLPAKIDFRELQTKTYKFDGITVKPAMAQHPQTATFTYRISLNGFSIVYATDTEHYKNEMDTEILKQARGADILIYDSQYTPEEYSSRTGWGHSTWLEGTKIAKAAGVKMLVLYHHDPSSTDEKIKAIEDNAKKIFPSTIAAKEGMKIHLLEEEMMKI